MSRKPNGVILLRSRAARRSSTLPFQATRYTRTASGLASRVPGQASTVPLVSPSGMGPAGDSRNRVSSELFGAPSNTCSVIGVVGESGTGLMCAMLLLRSFLACPRRECVSLSAHNGFQFGVVAHQHRHHVVVVDPGHPLRGVDAGGEVDREEP